MASFDQFKGSLNTIIQYLKEIARHTRCLTCQAATGASTGANSSVPADFRYLKITKVGGTGTVQITMPDATVYTLTADGQTLEFPFGPTLPAFTISTSNGATWNWIALS